MKHLLSLISSLLIITFCSAQGIEITCDKTTSLIFPFPIRHVDRGTKDILVQPVVEQDHILMVKAGVKDFPATNLSVVTTDGSIYSFPVQYSSEPQSFVYQVPAQKSASIETYANGILDNRRTIRTVHDYKWNISSRVSGIYVKDKVIFYQLHIDNKSSIDYDIEFLRFYIRDNKKGKRTAVQENELKPLFIAGNTSQVKANGNSAIVVALDKFTIPDAKYLAVQIMEKNGGRHLLMKVSNKNIMHAIPLPDLK